MLRLKTFGALKVLRDGEFAEDKEIPRRPLSVLSVLATDGDQGVTRDRLIGLFWPDREPEKARALLHMAFYKAHQTFGGDVVLEGQASLQLNPAILSSDVAEFRQALARGDLAAAVGMYSGPFLDAVYISGAPEFEQWVNARRTALARQCVEALLTLSRRSADSGDLAGAVEYARRASSEDRHSGEAAAQLMRVLAWSGDDVGAINAYRVHAALVKEDLDAEPNADLTTLLEEIRKGAVRAPKKLTREPAAETRPISAPPPAQPTPAPDPGPSVAVLFFVNISPDPKHTYFADGITEAIINALSRLDGIRVCARTTMLAYRDYAGDVRELGRRLGVRTVVEGTVITDGQKVRISAKLNTVADGSHRFLGQFDRELVDIFAVQDEIAQAIARTLQLSLTGTGAPPRPPVVTAAYEQYLLGRHYRDKRSPAGMRRALACYREALRISPEFAQAFAAQADTLQALLAYGVADPTETAAGIRATASRAMALDPTMAEPHAALGAVAAMCDRDWATAERYFQQAISLDPHYETGHMWYANYCLAPRARFEEGLETLARARQQDPLSPVINTSIGMTLFFARRYDESVEQLERALDVDPGFAFANYLLGRVETMRGRFPAAIDSLERAVASSEGAGVTLSALGYAHARAGDDGEARSILARLSAPPPDDPVSSFEAAFVHLGLGEAEAALAGFERAADERTPFAIWLGVQPEVDHLRGTPRLDALVRRVGVRD